MIGEVTLFGLFTAISIQDAMQNKIDDYLSGLLYLCYAFLFPVANFYLMTVSFGLLIVLCRYAEDCPNIKSKGFLGWGDCLCVPILLSFSAGIFGMTGAILWLCLGIILGILTNHVIKRDKGPLMPMLWISFLILYITLIIFHQTIPF